jgi:hypothetical protein
LKHKKYQNNPDSVEAFFQALEIEKDRLERLQKPFTVLMFLNLDRRALKELEPIFILGDEITLVEWDELSHLKVNDLWHEVAVFARSNPILLRVDSEKPIPRMTVFQPVLVTLTTYGPEAAVATASDRLDILRAILNMSSLLGKFTYFRSKPSHLSSILPSPIYGTFDDSGQLVITYYTTEKYVYTRSTIKEQQFANVQYLLPFFAKHVQYPDTYHHIAGLMRLYQDALDINLPRPAFLAMWQVLESAVRFRQEKTPQREIASRVSALIEPDPILHDALKLLTNLRNDMVHSGEFLERGDATFFTLKLIADACLSRLVALANGFPTVHSLCDYIENVTLGDSALKRKMEVLSTIQQHRQG